MLAISLACKHVHQVWFPRLDKAALACAYLAPHLLLFVFLLTVQ